MKILIANYRYFVSGGPERYMFNLSDLLISKGHQVIPFSIKYSQNTPSEYSSYFASPLSKENEVKFKDQSWNIRAFTKTISRAIYSPEVYNKLSLLIKKEKPDFAIVLHYLRKLSPSVLKALDDNNVPFIVRLSDFAMICSNAHLIHGNEICELCVKRNGYYSILKKCVQGSLSASLINYLGMEYNKLAGNFNRIKYFVLPSKFTMSKMIESGWPAEKMVHIPTFVNQPGILPTERKNRILYVGRIENVKGVHVLLQAIKLVNERLHCNSFSCDIIGDGDRKYIEELKSFANTNKLSNVNFLNKLDKGNVFKIISESLFTISPSIWYDNLPNSVLESLSCGTPVIASRHGSFLELIEESTNGLLFEPGNAMDLADKIEHLLINKTLLQEMSKKAVEIIYKNYNPEMHYEKLMLLYKRLINKEKEDNGSHCNIHL